jgi:outer membrane usher protein FimD/PapC
LTHKQNQLIIKKRVESILNPNYIPCIYVKSERKGPLFGNIQQDINRHGAGTLSAQLGYRSPFKKYDHLQLNLEWPLQTKLNKRYYQFGLSWNNPLKRYGDFFIKYNSGNDPIYENIDANANGLSCGLSKGKESYELEWSYRVPFIHSNTTN